MVSRITFGGLASGLDTAGIIDQLLQLETRPITQIVRQQTQIQQQADAFKDLRNRMAALEDKAFAMTQLTTLSSRKTTVSETGRLNMTASGDANTGSATIEVARLATATRVQSATGAGQGNTLGGIANADLLTYNNTALSDLNTQARLQEPISEGTLYINGQLMVINSGQTLGDVLSAIGTATGGAVTASLVPDSGGLVVELASATPISLASGTSNLWNVLRLNTATYNGDTDTLRSTAAINGVRTDRNLDGSEGATNLAQSVTSGLLTINGEPISYNAANDSIADIISRINSSAAGVSASFSALGGGQVILTRKQQGPESITLSDTGNLAAALGLQAPASLQLGQSAQVSINGGSPEFFNSNTGVRPAALTGVTLDLLQAEVGKTLTVTIDTDTEKTVTAAKEFITQYNGLVAKVRELTKYDVQSKTKGLLLGDASTVGVLSQLSQLLNRTVTGLSEGNGAGTLVELGFNTGSIGSLPGTTNELTLDENKLRTALRDTPTRVAEIFGAREAESTEGIFTRFKSYFDGYSNATGLLAGREKAAQQRIDNLDDRVNTLTDRLSTRRALLEARFQAMETTLTRLQGQQSSLASLINRTNR
jgi:flagellar hook-associated protein 2